MLMVWMPRRIFLCAMQPASGLPPGDVHDTSALPLSPCQGRSMTPPPLSPLLPRQGLSLRTPAVVEGGKGQQEAAATASEKVEAVAASAGAGGGAEGRATTRGGRGMTAFFPTLPSLSSAGLMSPLNRAMKEVALKSPEPQPVGRGGWVGGEAWTGSWLGRTWVLSHSWQGGGGSWKGPRQSPGGVHSHIISSSR